MKSGKSTFAKRMLDFYSTLRDPGFPRNVDVMNPYLDPRVLEYLRSFLDRYFSDSEPRLLVFGINPGRFGAGVTGVTFTDPVVLADICGIPNHLPRKRELSSVFIYSLIERMGGPAAFYSRVYLTAASPLGFTRDGKNLNFYDDRLLERAATPFIVDSMRKQIIAGGRSDHAIVLGAGENFRFLERLNTEHHIFGQLHPLEHPRFIMQYRRKRLDEYLARYEDTIMRLAND